VKRLALLLVVLALFAAGCASTGGPGAPSAATVNGTDISMSSFYEDLDAFAQNDDVRQALQLAEPFAADGGDTSYTTEYTAQVLSYRIGNLLIEQELDSTGQAPSDGDVEQAEQALSQVAGTADLPEAVRTRLVGQLANQQALDRILSEQEGGDTVTDESVRQYYDDNLESFMSSLGGEAACLSHILIAFDPTNLSAAEPTPEQDAEALGRAEQAVSRVQGGEDFAAVATISDDTGSATEGGDIGCIGRGTGYPVEFEEAALTQPLGEVGEPVRSEFGYHVLFVRTRGVVPFEEIQDEIRTQLEQQAQQSGGALGPWLQEASAAADVTVDPRFGTFDPASGNLVVPPEGPSPAGPSLGGLDELIGGEPEPADPGAP
jgi:parvulin-like peptidyl-prolyl isomerase